jgi:predicted PurR-regulated permease PerM
MDEEKNGKVTIEFSFASIFWVLGIILSLWLFVNLQDILMSLVLAFILATAIAPLIDLLQKKKIPRPLSITIIYLLLVGVIVLIVRLVVPPFLEQISAIFQNRLSYIDTMSGYFGSFGEPLRLNLLSAVDKFSGSFTNVNYSGLITGAKGIFSGIIDVILIFVLSFYFLLSKNGIEKIITQYIPKQFQKKVTYLYRKISKKMSSWLQGQVFLGLIIFVVNYIGLSILRVDYALTLAIISGMLEVLPIIGPWVAGGLATIVALTVSPLLALIVAAWYVLVQQLENHIIVPLVMKKSLGLNPIAVILALLIGGKLLGILGIIISVPVAAAIGVLLEEFVKIKETEASVGN